LAVHSHNVNLLTPVRDYIESLVHPSVRQDGLMAARHRAFIAPRIVGGFLGLASFPLSLAIKGIPHPLEIVVFGWFLAPILTAYFLARTAALERAHLLSCLALTALVSAVAAQAGGLTTLAAGALLLVPMEAALSASRRVVAAAAGLAGGAALALLVAGPAGLALIATPAASGSEGLAAFGLGAALLYATLLASGSAVAARMSAERRGREEDRYRLLALNMTDVISRHGRNGVVTFISPAAERLFGVPVSELTGHGLFDRVHVGDRPAYLTALADAAACGEPRSVEFRLRRNSAEVERRQGQQFIWLEMRCRPLDVQHGDAGAREVVAVMRDVTERKLHEQEIADARRQAEQADAAKGRFLATMSHELRTPLNAVIGFSDMLMNEQEMKIDAVRRLDYARLINDSGQHLLSVVNLVLDMSKIESGNFVITPEPFAPAAAIRNCCDLLALKARDAGLDIVVGVAADLPEIVADKRALKQMLLNLLSNAIKFTERGGAIAVRAAVEGAHLSVAVEDNGVGISAADLPRLGDPFFQARDAYNRPYEGTGLGLSIVKGLVTLHGGRMEIESRLGKGTRVVLLLPLDCERGGRAMAKAESPTVLTRNLEPVLMLPDVVDQPLMQVKKRA
jgi:cell cycle sensor histidine kinase DivJ